MKKLFVFTVVMTVIFSMGVPIVYANGSGTVTTVTTANTTPTSSGSNTMPITWPTDSGVNTGNTLSTTQNSTSFNDDANGIIGGNDIIPHVTIDDLSERFYNKGFEIIHFLQKVAGPFAIILFIIGALMALVGSLGNGQLAGKGFWSMTISVVMYACVLYAPLIVQTGVGWLTT